MQECDLEVPLYGIYPRLLNDFGVSRFHYLLQLMFHQDLIVPHPRRSYFFQYRYIGVETLKLILVHVILPLV